MKKLNVKEVLSLGLEKLKPVQAKGREGLTKIAIEQSEKQPKIQEVVKMEKKFKVVNTLVTGSGKEAKQAPKILGYVLENLETNQRKGFTVSESAALVHEFGAVNAEVHIRPILKDGEVVDHTIYLAGVGLSDESSKYSLRQQDLILPIINSETNTYQCVYSPALTELADRRLTKESSGRTSRARSREERLARVSEVLKAKNLTAVSF